MFVLKVLGRNNLFRLNRINNVIKRNGHEWNIDPQYVKYFDGPVMYDKEKWSHLTPTPDNGKMLPPERKVQNLHINFGPAHPAAHGVLRMVVELDGEIVRSIIPHIGLLHRATEKLMEYKTYLQNVPYFDRLDYVAPFANSHAFVLGIEKLLNLEVPRRAKYIRVLFLELTRLLNHLLAIATHILDIGAITPLFWLFEEREKLFEIFERATGARMHTAYVRPGGVATDIPLGLMDDIHDFMRKIGTRMDEVEDVVSGNRMWKERTKDVGYISAEDALNWGFTGPMLRASGVKWDIRKARPYEVYDELDFEVPVGQHGDAFDRYFVRLAELRQSIRLINQCLNNMPEGEIRTDDYKISPTPRAEMKNSMEGVIHHFKLFTQGFCVPPGAVYSAVEHPKGEMGVYLVSDGTSVPYRCKIKPPSFNHLQGIAVLGKNKYIADIVAIMGTIDIVMGDIDR